MPSAYGALALIAAGAMLAGEVPLPPEGIMAKMAANVESATAARQQYVYEQRVRSSLVRTSGEISRWEKRTYTVLPTPEGTEKKLASFQGEYRKGKLMYPYQEPGFEYKDIDIDASLIAELTSDLVDDKKSRDGIPHSLFPLRASDLSFYRFTWKGETTVNGRRTFEIGFEPSKRKTCISIGSDDECGDSKPWKGTAWVDAEEYQPVRMSSDLAVKVPWGVKVFLGTNLSQTGFSLAYQRVAENVWFPVTYGTEFRLNVLWGYKRTITLSLESSGFRKTAVTTNVKYEASNQ